MKKLTLEDLLRQLNAGEIEIELLGHCSEKTHPEAKAGVFERIVEDLNDLASYPKETKDIQEALDKGETPKFPDGRTIKDPERMIKHYEEEYDFFTSNALEFGNMIRCFSLRNIHCHECGGEYTWYLKDEKTISLVRWYDKRCGENDFTCPLADGIKPTVNEVNFPTGEIVLVNFFDDRYKDSPKGKEKERFEPDNKYSDEFSLNSALGQMNLSAHYANNHDVLYGQMGGMSLSVWVNKDKSVIHLAEYCLDEHNDNEESASLIKEFKKGGFKEVGTISLAMWRWMAADMATVKKHNISLENSENTVIIKGEPGKWKGTHYYMSDFPKNKFLYATIEKS